MEQKLLVLLMGAVALMTMPGCSGEKQTDQPHETVAVDTTVVKYQLEPTKMLHIFGGNLSQYYFARSCTVTRLTRMELEERHVDIKDDYHYYIVSIALEKNSTPFEFPIDDIECIYKVWLVPTMFPDGKFNLHAQIMNTRNRSIAQIDFSHDEGLKNLLRKCPNEGDFMIVEDMFEIERAFDHPTNKVDIQGYIKPVVEGKKKAARH